MVTSLGSGDGRLTGAGDLQLRYRPGAVGLFAGTDLHTTSSNYDYDGFGRATDQRMTRDNGGSDVDLHRVQSSYDKLGRLTRTTETLILTDAMATTRTFSVEDLGYQYDQRGHLTEVRQYSGGGHSVVAEYGYDANGNRTSCADSFGTVTAEEVVIDAQDRLLEYGGLTFAYDKSGSLRGRSDDGGLTTTTFVYSPDGALIEVDRPGSSPTITYTSDFAGRRIGKSVGGTKVQGFLYGVGGVRPVAEMDGDGEIVSVFVYATKLQTPDYMLSSRLDPEGDLRTYRIISVGEKCLSAQFTSFLVLAVRTD